MTKAVVVLAKQRSGTNLFRLALKTSEKFVDLNEIFHHNLAIGKYWNFRKNLIINNPDLSIPTEKNQSFIFDSFLKEIIPDNNLFSLIDIKYISVHNLNGIWKETTTVPFLLKLLAEHKIAVIHLVRHNILARYISSLVASKLKKWVLGSGETIEEDVTVYVDVKTLIKSLRNASEEINLYRRWLSEFKTLNSIEVAYESLIDDNNNFSERVISEISDFLNIKEKLNISIPTKKIVSRPLEEIIENYYSEVVPALRSTEFAYLLYWGK
jgi:LPS sulfotransferase NodH